MGFSQGSNRSLEYLNSNSIDFASTAGLAAVLSRANGSQLKRFMYKANRNGPRLLSQKFTN